jgi:hypothetical protein
MFDCQSSYFFIIGIGPGHSGNMPRSAQIDNGNTALFEFPCNRVGFDSCDDSVAAPIPEPIRGRCSSFLLCQIDRPVPFLFGVRDNTFNQAPAVSIGRFNQQRN